MAATIATADELAAPRSGWVILATALAYLLVGVPALQLAIPPGYASPLYPPAGIALAAALVYGRAGVIGAAIGACLANMTLVALRGHGDAAGLAISALIGLGSGAQAWLGACTVRRFARHPNAIDEPRDVAVLFVLGGAAACLLAPTFATAVLVASGSVPRADALVTWITWWAGDTFGAMIATPVVLTLIGRPRADWAARRAIIGLTLGLVTLLMALGIVKVSQWDDERLHTAFMRDATHAATALETRLREPLLALEAMRGVFIASEDVSRDEMRRASEAGWPAAGWQRSAGTRRWTAPRCRPSRRPRAPKAWSRSRSSSARRTRPRHLPSR
ncbi:hypothetical protein FSC37_03005 [Piscinibacter aquaticus]|uniref:MASE1 domain-containing protein n=1 Tax=Piscinibacter aquaticus TaxID=392597 RepID=A0A5C6TY58_9BURK|nr:hypothetical protein FSC37_03005 [Piscinibacter aquaticus]